MLSCRRSIVVNTAFVCHACFPGGTKTALSGRKGVPRRMKGRYPRNLKGTGLEMSARTIFLNRLERAPTARWERMCYPSGSSFPVATCVDPKYCVDSGLPSAWKRARCRGLQTRPIIQPACSVTAGFRDYCQLVPGSFQKVGPPERKAIPSLPRMQSIVPWSTSQTDNIPGQMNWSSGGRRRWPPGDGCGELP